METIQATCPRCHETHAYGAELIGRYTLCTGCSCRFYVEVPELTAEVPGKLSGPPLTAAVSEATTLDDLLWDTQQGSRFIMQALKRMEARLFSLLCIATVLAAVVSAELIAVTALWWR